jgi:hypothetical protein
MRIMAKFTIPTTEESNAKIRDGSIEQTMETLVGNLQPRQRTSAPSMVSEAGTSSSIWRKHPREFPS